MQEHAVQHDALVQKYKQDLDRVTSDATVEATMSATASGTNLVASAMRRHRDRTMSTRFRTWLEFTQRQDRILKDKLSRSHILSQLADRTAARMRRFCLVTAWRVWREVALLGRLASTETRSRIAVLHTVIRRTRTRLLASGLHQWVAWREREEAHARARGTSTRLLGLLGRRAQQQRLVGAFRRWLKVVRDDRSQNTAAGLVARMFPRRSHEQKARAWKIWASLQFHHHVTTRDHSLVDFHMRYYYYCHSIRSKP